MVVKNKKHQILLLLLLFILFSCNFDKKSKKNLNNIEEDIANDYNDVISPIQIDSLIDNGKLYIKKEFDLDDYSSEGGIMQSYSDEKDYLTKIKATYFGHSGKSEWNYYFKNDSLFFVDKQEFRYIRPISNEGNIIIDSVLKSEYFLEKANLIKWIDENKFIIDSASEKFKQENNYLKQDIKEFREIIKKSPRCRTIVSCGKK